MRDPARMKRILGKLGKFWESVPDWRLGQLYVNVASTDRAFYVEDDTFEALLDGWLKEVSG